jgi:hypothetical protein
MFEPDTIVLSTKPRWRRLWWSAAITGPLLLISAWLGYQWYWDRDFRAAIAETDRLDPGWRLFDLEAARAEIPDSENSAIQVLAAKKLLPAGWFSLRPASPTTPLEDALDCLSPVERLNPDQSEQIDAELVKAAAALPPARQLANMPRGRYAISWTPNAIGTLVPHIELVRDVGRLLRLDALQRAEKDDIDGALISCRAVLNTGRSFGDETTAISQLVRLAYQRLTLRTLERALAQGSGSETGLVEIQRLLEDEADQPLSLIAARAERAAIHQFLEFVERGGHYRASFGMRSATGSNDLDEFLDRAKARGCHAAYLRYLNQYVEIAKLPPEQQVEGVRHVEMQPPENVPQLLAALGGFNVDLRKLTENFHHSLAFLHCGVAAVAVERYRLAHGRWPERLQDLVPTYLSKIPVDPCQPLRYRRLKDGVIIYTVCEEQQDNGGQRVRIKARDPDRDVGFQLWDPEQRRQLAQKK